jgi:dTDP-4-amino-4,6-dideoxygalactose transaminase
MSKTNAKRHLFGGYPGARYIGEEEASLVQSVIEAKSPYRYYGMEPMGYCNQLEDLLCEVFKRQYGLCLSSGTAALHTALYAAGVRPGDEVILPSYAWSADLMTIIALGATPVIAPIDETLGIDPCEIRACFSEKTKAVLAVHMRGFPCDVKALRNETEHQGIVLIEDCAQCIGGTINEQPVGSFGDMAILSFQYNKLITSGEGGAILADSQMIYERAKCFHDLGMSRDIGAPDPMGSKAILSFGLNYRLSELQSAFVLAQSRKLPSILSDLKKVYGKAKTYLSGERELFGLRHRKEVKDAEPNGAFYCLQSKTRQSVEETVKMLHDKELPASWCGALDPHHFATWEMFMSREKIAYKIFERERSAEILGSALFFELNPRAAGLEFAS